MRVLCHRGYWLNEAEKNTFSSIKRAFESGRGIESDIRDYQGEIVISHNPADSTAIRASDVFSLMHENEDKYLFAINIKADGLQDKLLKLLDKYQIHNYFTFDMSVPQMIEYEQKGIRYFTRQSEFEQQPVLYEHAAGVWIDAFKDDSWITEELLCSHQKNHKMVCIVSPDLHQKTPDEFWKRLIQYRIDWNNVLLCTDKPDQADKFFQNVLS